MANGKETPRQKMIGLMYLVLTAMLALNVSKQILKGFVMVNESIEKSKLILDENNLRVRQAFESYVNQGNYEAKPYLLKAIDAQKAIRQVDAYLDSIKLVIVQRTESLQKTDTSQLRFMDKLDDYDTPTYLLIGSDESSPKQTKYSASDLRLQLNNLHHHLITMLDNMQKDKKTMLDSVDLNTLKQKLNSIKPTDRNILDDGVKLNWELENFYHLPMAAIITNLSKMQADIKQVESEFLHVFASASSKFDFKIDQLQAKVIAPTAFVLSGQSFKASVLLSASSTELTPERMKVLVGAEYNEGTKKITVPGTELSITNGMGQYEMVAGKPGVKDLKGVVVYKNPRGEDEYYPFNFPYTVSLPFTAVSADNMNIFYAGVENPVSVSAAGFAPADLKVEIAGCGAAVKTNGTGNYSVTATSTGTCMVHVLGKVNGVYQPQGPPKLFRVKSVPDPVLKIAGKLATTTLEFTKGDINAMGTLVAECPGFMFSVNMMVKSFDLQIYGVGPTQYFHSDDNKITYDMRKALSKLKKGHKIYIDEVKVQMPNGVVQKLNMAQIKFKS